MPGWFDLAQNKLDRGDKIQKSYFVKFDGKRGYLMMSNKKLLFVEEKGFLSKTYNLVLEIPYKKVSEVNVERNQLVLGDGGGKNHNIAPIEVYALKIESNLKDLMESA